ncbi:MAG: hypothetical protein LBV40_08040, partial [Methanomicrobiales archaeon]|nr:hypothetical protein [Methanomicrobiales archaeon]
MDKIIEDGFTRLVDVINTQTKDIDTAQGQLQLHDGTLFEKMGRMAAPIANAIGIEILSRGKVNLSGEIYDPKYYEIPMIVLGRSLEVAPFRPDDPNKKISDQFCTLGSDGVFYEILYSQDELIVDSFLGELTGRQVLDIYGYEAMYMLYKALHQYADDQEQLLLALASVMELIG